MGYEKVIFEIILKRLFIKTFYIFCMVIYFYLLVGLGQLIANYLCFFRKQIIYVLLK